MSSRKFYMVRLKGGLWEPRRKYTNLKKVMEVACKMSEYHKKPATVLQTISQVEYVKGKPIWTATTPER